MSQRNLLFVLNPDSGNKDDISQQYIIDYFKEKKEFTLSFFIPDWESNVKEDFSQLLNSHSFDTVVASGGDGTVNFIAKNIYGKNIKLGILPTGSANGLAKNLSIPLSIPEALQVIEENHTQRVSSITVNDHFCIHLADIGLNASIVRRFERQKTRGFLGYFKAFRATIFNQKKAHALITTDDNSIDASFYMLVFCNGTGYGTGLAINPEGRLDDSKFEIVNVKKLSLLEALRLYWGQDKPHPDYAKISSCRHVTVDLKKPIHLQVDGEYLGKTKKVTADFNDLFIDTLVPKKNNI
ncbi:hypothetical protein KRX57_06395 [Weeksellaceae bacterium TAE3-ERU29]|nr:hypothetical protein [Weeksellaceae bacterium TAE3-ERU29]